MAQRNLLGLGAVILFVVAAVLVWPAGVDPRWPEFLADCGLALLATFLALPPRIVR